MVGSFRNTIVRVLIGVKQEVVDGQDHIRTTDSWLQAAPSAHTIASRWRHACNERAKLISSERQVQTCSVVYIGKGEMGWYKGCGVKGLLIMAHTLTQSPGCHVCGYKDGRLPSTELYSKEHITVTIHPM